jgi:hypothetical protein
MVVVIGKTSLKKSEVIGRKIGNFGFEEAFL